MKTEKGLMLEVTRKSEGRRISTYDEEQTIALEEIPEEKLESDIKAGQVRG